MPITHVRVAARQVLGECELPFRALSLTRKVLDEALLQHAQASGVTLTRGCRVESLVAKPGGWVAQLQASTERAHTGRSGRTAFLATGKHDVKDWPRPAGSQNDLVAFKMYFTLAPAQRTRLYNHVELILFPGGYAGLQCVENDKANLCVLVRRSALRRLGSSWSNLLEHMLGASPHLATRLAGASTSLAKPLAIAAIPYGHIPSARGDGLWRLGDQAAVIPSFTGSGMSLALHSARVAASAYLQGHGPTEFAGRVHDNVHRPVQLATMISRLMVASPALAGATRWWPQAIHLIAQKTRIPMDAPC